MAYISTSPARGHARPAASPLARLLRLGALLRSRRDLASLDPHLLKDIGVSPDDARREAERPIWDVPAHWLR